jgi:hypothetical protein
VDLDVHLDRSTVERVNARCWRIVCRDEADRRHNGFDKRGRLLIIILGARVLVIFGPFYNVLDGCRLFKSFHILLSSGCFPPLVDVAFYQSVFVGLSAVRQTGRPGVLVDKQELCGLWRTDSVCCVVALLPPMLSYEKEFVWHGGDMKSFNVTHSKMSHARPTSWTLGACLTNKHQMRDLPEWFSG